MGLLARWFDTTAIDRIVAGVVDELLRSVPPARLASSSSEGKQRREQFDRRIGVRLRKLTAEQRLNVYQKARLGTRLQAALEAAGYPGPFCKEFAYDVVTRVAALANESSR